jgi:hypothetical protein
MQFILSLMSVAIVTAEKYHAVEIADKCPKEAQKGWRGPKGTILVSCSVLAAGGQCQV